MKYWTKVTAVLGQTPEDWAVFANVFDEQGIPGTVQTDRPPTISGYAYEPEEAALDELRSELKRVGAVEVVCELVPEEDWAESWKQFFKPRRIGKRFVVRPTWEPFEAGLEDLEIVLDPGQAFGTGDHPTTRLCLELMEDAVRPGCRVADIGCGSGILAIGALKLGATEVVCVDVEKQSIESTLENAARNEVCLRAMEGTGFEPIAAQPNLSQSFDLVFSNIISAALIRLAPEAAKRVVPGGAWIVSGIISANWPDVREAAEKNGFRFSRRLEEGDWTAAEFHR